MKALTFLIMSALLAAVAGASAGQPENPGVFGRDRAEIIKGFQEDDGQPGASEWGERASFRGSTNGDLNRDYKDSHGGSPTHGNGDSEED